MSTDWFRITNEDEIPSPALLLYPDRIEENLRRMIAGAGGAERLRPHVKTHKLPQVVQLQLQNGIRKFKTATIAETEMAAAAGAEDILLAYPLIGPNPVRLCQLIQKFPATTFRTIADSTAGVKLLSAAATAAGVTVNVLLDLDVGMHRTGIAPGPDAMELYRRLSQSPGLTAGGLHAYDGHLKQTDRTSREAAAEAAFGAVWEFRQMLLAAGLPVPLVVASGTPTFEILAQEPGVEVGAGTTVLWDYGQPQSNPDLDFLNAAVLMGRVVSRPTADRVTIDLGHKALASEMPHPRVKLLGVDDARFVAHSEEHLVFETHSAANFPVGTVVYGLPWHICPTVALQSEVFVVRDSKATETWPVVARARRITV